MIRPTHPQSPRLATIFAVSFTLEQQSTDPLIWKLDNAYLEAQAQGKRPELCATDSAFANYYNGCNTCIDQYAGQEAASGHQWIDNVLSPYLDYCTASEPSSASISTSQSSATIPTSWLTHYGTFEPTTLSNLPISGATISTTSVLYESINVTYTISAYFFHTSVQSLISSYIPPAVFSELAASAASAASLASVTGDPTSLIYAALEDVSRPPWFSSAVPSTYVAEMSTLEASINELRATPVSTASATTASDSAAPSTGGTKSTSMSIVSSFFPHSDSRLAGSMSLICLITRLWQ